MKKIILIVFLAIYSIANAQYTQLTNFTGPGTFTGAYPMHDQNLISVNNTLYGLSACGGSYESGTIFKINPDGTGFEKLLDFTGEANGLGPVGTLISDGTFLYGMTSSGGTYDLGTIFKIKPDGTGFQKLLDFMGINGQYPFASLIADGTFLYGTTKNGGTHNFGTVFKIKKDGSGFEKLVDFTGTANGSDPWGSLFSDGTFLYGTTYSGGTDKMGTIFKVKHDGSDFKKLLDFNSYPNGKSPASSFISDGTFLYAMTNQGGKHNLGILYKIRTDGTDFQNLLDFDWGTTGRYPWGSLIFSGGFLYGTASAGGLQGLGCIFKIKTDGTEFEGIYDFKDADGGFCPMGSLLSDGTFFYAMTKDGGNNKLGTIFKVKTDGTLFKKISSFMGATNGRWPMGSLLTDGSLLYGMTKEGGAYNLGCIFKIKNDGSGFEKLLDFNGEKNGSFPMGSLYADDVFMYGMTSQGGTNGLGTIFKISAEGYYTKLLDFNGTLKGAVPMGSLISDGIFLYGMTKEGGQDNMGTVFKIKPDGSGYSKLLDFGGGRGYMPHGSLCYDGSFLYGMTTYGGDNFNDWGTVFKIKPDGTEYTKLMDFIESLYGAYPNGDLIYDGTYLYGIASQGASSPGIIFRMRKDGSDYSPLYDFKSAEDGKSPMGSLLSDGTYLYGTTVSGGAFDDGTVFKIKKDGSNYSKLSDFKKGVTGINPHGSLISDGMFLYGTTAIGGSADAGTVFKVSQTEVGITEYDTQMQLNAYPNPFHSFTTLKTDQILKDATLIVYNVFGQEVKQVAGISGQTINLNRDNLPGGFYFARLIQNNKIIAGSKLIINN